MNCTRCNAELPDGATFCPQCGCPVTNKAIFPPEPMEQQPSGQYPLLIGAACVLGAIMLIAMFVGLALLNSLTNSRAGGSCCGTTEEIQRIYVGADFPLYGKTINDEDFVGESLQGKYVLVKFTATWCGPCKGEIPGMLEAYEKYHDKGLEIVSVYIWQQESDPVTAVKSYVEKEKLPWIIVSEALTEKSGQPPQSKFFRIQEVPTMLLLDEVGDIHATNMRGEALKRELEKLFGE